MIYTVSFDDLFYELTFAKYVFVIRYRLIEKNLGYLHG